MVDMNKSFVLRKEDRNPQWRVIDAEGQVLGRLATHIANALRGKDHALYTPHTDSGDYIVVINAEKVKLTGKKMEQKEYVSHSGWVGNRKVLSARQVMEKDPTRIIKKAVERMLPKNKLSRSVFDKLRVYVGANHPHAAQVAK